MVLQNKIVLHEKKAASSVATQTISNAFLETIRDTHCTSKILHKCFMLTFHFITQNIKNTYVQGSRFT